MSVVASVRRFARPAVHRLRDERAAFRIAGELRSAADETPNLLHMRRLAELWSNSSFRATPEYLLATAEAAKLATKPILECGSGISTLVAARWASQPVHALEHMPAWAQKVRLGASRSGLSPIVHDAPLRSCGDYDWYLLPATLPEAFALVICDGPPGTTRGGRFGLVPELRDRLSGAMVLLGDADRDGESATIRRWSDEFGATVLHHDRHALLQLP